MRRVAATMGLAFVLAFVGCGQEKGPATAARPVPPLPVKVITVKKERIPIWAEFTGTTRASSEQKVRARVSGRLEKRYFQDGEIVKKGQKLFLIEPDRYEAALKAARAVKKRHLADLKLARSNVERYRPLVEEGLAPRIKLEEYVAQYEKIKADLLSDEANIEKAKLDLDYTLVRSPVDGKIGARRVDVGNLVGYGEPTILATVLRFDPIYLYFSPTAVEAKVIQKYRSGGRMPARLRIPSNDPHVAETKLEGYVDFSDNTVDPATSTIQMRATFPNPKMEAYPGSFGYVEIFITDRQPIVAVPPISVFEDQEGKFVYTVGKDGKAERTGIEVGLVTRHFVQVEKGLEEGQEVVVSGLTKIAPGRPLKVEEASRSEGVLAKMREGRFAPGAD